MQVISWRYPAVEALSAGLWISALLVWPGAGGGLPDLWLPWAGLPLIALLLPLVLIDLDHLWLPEPLCRWGVGAGLAGQHRCWDFLFWQPFDRRGAGPAAAWKASVPWPNGCWDSLRWVWAMPSWRRWVGHGWAPGASQRPMALAVVSGALVGSTARLSGRLGPREPFPFGPFIALGIWLVWLTGPQWWWSTWLMLLGA